MGARIAAFDWSSTALGPIQAWPQSLRTTIGLMLNSGFPSYLAWGSGLISFYNDACCPLLGGKPEALGRSFGEVWSEAWPAVGPVADRAVRGEAGYVEDLPLTLECRRDHREETWWTLSSTPVRDESGSVGGVLCTMQETSARVRAEAAQQASEALRSAILAGALDCVITIDDEDRIIEWNLAAERTFGHGRTAVLGRDVAELVMPPEHRPAHRRGLAQYLVTGEGPFLGRRIEVEALRADGSRFPVELAVTPIAIDGRTLFTLYLRDITGRKRAERALRASEERFRKFSQETREGVVIHDGTKILDCNEAYARMFGFAGAADAIGHSPSALVSPASLPLRLERNTAHDERPYEVEARRVDSSTFPAQFVGREVEWQGHLVRVGLVRDLTEEKRAQAALRESEERFRATFEQAAVGVAHVALDGRWLRVNRSLCAMLGYTEAELLARSFQEITHPDDLAKDLAHVRQLVSGEVPSYSMEKRYLRSSGEIVWVMLTVSVRRDLDSGAPLHFISVIEDITPRKRVEAALRESEERYRVLTEVSPQAVWMARPDGFITYCNQWWFDYTGLTMAQTEGLGWMAVVHPSDREPLTAMWLQAAAMGDAWSFEIRLRRASDGQYRWHLARGLPIRDRRDRHHPDEIVGCMGVATDIHEQREAEERLRLAQRAGGIGTFELDASTRTLAVSEEFCRLWGLPQQDTVSLDRLLDMIHPEDRPRVATSHHEIRVDALDYVEYRVASADTGEERWLARRGGAKSGAPSLRGADAETTRFVGVVYDVTDRKRMEAALRDLNETLEVRVAEEVAERAKAEEALRQSQKMEAVGQLTGGLAHDFNNLLTGISGSLELLNTRIAQGRLGEMDRYVTAAQGAAKRAASLTHRLLAFSRRQTLDPKATDVNRLVAGMEELVRRTVGPAITVEVVAAGGLWTTLIDPGQLENALLNLCINARDAMPDGGRLTIETCNKWLDHRAARERELVPGQYITLCVSDTGSGMAPDVIRRAFDPFFTTKPIGMGTGLGLSMVYGFVRQSGGHARIYSELGQGTTLCLYLPRHFGKAENVDLATETAQAPRAERSETVLVVDDEPTVRMLVAEVLEDLGYAAIEAADGAGALDTLRAGTRVDLLVTDVGLPGMNGRQVADAARALRPGLKVLFITGYAENAVIGNGHLDPGMHVLTKPFAMDALASRIEDIMTGA